MAAWTNEGVGAAKTATIQSGIEPVLPGPPSRLAVSNIEAFSVVLQFTPGFDGNSSITKWTVQVMSVFQLILERCDVLERVISCRCPHTGPIVA